MESQVRSEIFSPLVAGHLREIVPDFTAVLPDGEVSASALLTSEGGKFQFEVHFTQGKMPPNIQSDSKRILTKSDQFSIRGTLGGKIAFEARDLFPASHYTTRSRGTATLILQSQRLHLLPKGCDLMNSNELRFLLKGAESEDLEGYPKTGEAHVIFHGPNIRLRNKGSKTHYKNDFLGDASSATLDTHMFTGEDYEGALIQKDRELHLHLRTKEGASFDAVEWDLLVDRIQECAAFTHGFHPWPLYREVRFDRRVLERWISSHLQLGQTSLSVVAESMEFDLIGGSSEHLASILPTLEAGLRLLPDDCRSGIEKLLWYFRATDFSELPHTTKLLMICTTLDGLMKLLAGANDPAERRGTDKLWKAGCEASGLSWDRWGKYLFECYGRHRHHLAHGWLLLAKNEDLETFFHDYPRLAAGLNTLIAAKCGYNGPIVSNAYADERTDIQFLRNP